MQPIDHAWNLLKADPEMDILEMASHSRAYPDRSLGGHKPARTTMNPIIARLIRERNEREGRLGGGEIPHYLESYGGYDKRPHAEYGEYGMRSMPGPSYEDRKKQSQDALEERGVEPGDKFSGDYLVSSPGPGTSRRSGRTVYHQLHFPYGGRAGPWPVSVEPGSPMAEMYSMAPKLEKLPEGLQPDWMSEFRGD